jgi:phosphotransferase system enzyme I (PtsI)
VSRLYEPLHPAILRTIRMVVRAARRRRIAVAVCGEMAADPVLLTLLIGLGLTEFSMAPTAIGVASRCCGCQRQRCAAHGRPGAARQDAGGS